MADYNSNSEQSDFEEEHEPEPETVLPRQIQRPNSLVQTVSTPRIHNQGPYLLGRDNVTKWNVHEPPTSTTPRQNILTTLPGVKAVARNARTPYKAWKLFFPDSMIDEIVRCTNEQLLVMSQNYKKGEK